MWFFIIVILLANGDVTQTRYTFQTFDACQHERAFMWHQRYPDILEITDCNE